MKRLLLILTIFPFFSYSQQVIEMRKENGIYTIPCKVNDLRLRFIFDTGASNVSMSLSEIIFMLKNDYISKDDIYGVSEAQLANGDIVENTEVLLRKIEIGDVVLNNVKAMVIHELAAPLLLGQSAIEKLGSYRINGANLILEHHEDDKLINLIKIGSEKVKWIWGESGKKRSEWYYKNSMKPITGKSFITGKYLNFNFYTELNLKDGKLDGEWKTWASRDINDKKNGQLIEKEYYKNGLPIGKHENWTNEGIYWGYQMFSQTGFLIKELYYQANEPVYGNLYKDVIDYELIMENGKKKFFKTYQTNGQLASLLEYNTDGERRKESTYMNGKISTKITYNINSEFYQEYYSNGSIKWEYTKKGGKREGIEKYYNKTGELFRESHFKNGNLLYKKCYSLTGELIPCN